MSYAEFTQPAAWLDKTFVGYVMNAELSGENQQVLDKVMRRIRESFGGAVYCPPMASLHITLLDLIAPLVDYDGRDKDALFIEGQGKYAAALANIIGSTPAFNVHFDELHVSPGAIYIQGHDDGQFQAIREAFLSKIELLPGTKLPPKIVHCSLARFTKTIDLEPITKFVANEPINITQPISNFRLTRVTREPLLEFETLKRYELKA